MFSCSIANLISLRQSRVIQIVADAEATGEQPPTVLPLLQLSGHVRGPTLADLRSVLALHHLACSLEFSLCHHDGYWPSEREASDKAPPDGLPEDLDRMPEWTERVHKAIYRTLIIGASLSRVYSDPLFRARGAGVKMELSQSTSIRLQREQLGFLEQYAVYDTAADLESGRGCFRSLGGVAAG